MTTLLASGTLALVPTTGQELPCKGKFSVWKKVYAVFVLCAVTAIASPAQVSFNSLFSFDGPDGADPFLMSFQGFDGNYYGTTNAGGAYSYGSVFSIAPDGVETPLYSFCSQTNCADGAQPQGGLVQATDGNFYGTTYAGGASNAGTIFQITTGATLTTLYSFCSQSNCPDGANPLAGLIQALDGNFYGTTSAGGTKGAGTVFELSLGGNGTWTETVLYSFCYQGFPCNDGINPYAGVVQGTDGNFYGTTSTGGLWGGGTVFQLIPGGTLNTLYSFCAQGDGNCTDGDFPTAALVQSAIDGNFYGTTYDGGANGYGTVFQITPAGALTTLYSFCSQGGDGDACSDGAFPSAGLIQATDSNFYGTTYNGGGTYGDNGTAFEITSTGTLTTLYTFCSQGGSSCTDGSEPLGGLFQDTSGIFYGTTSIGGTYNSGTVLSIDTGLGPFVEPQPTAGKVEAKIFIRGNNLTGASKVTFNGTPAKFKVVSGTEITAAVPSKATTGKLQVTIPGGGTLKSNVVVRIMPQIKSFTPTSGPVGTPVTIRGVSLKQTTKVMFGGVKATKFTVNSDTEVTADVPMGAKTRKIGITTQGGTATSKEVFTVTE